MAHAIRGEAKRRLGDHGGATDDYQKAFDIDPTFEAAGLQLIAAQLAADDVPGAARTLATLQEHADGPLVKLRAVQVAGRQGDLAAGADRVRRPDDRPGRDPRRAPRGGLGAGRGRAGRPRPTTSWTTALEEPDVTPAAAGLWVERTASAGEAWTAGDRLAELIDRNREAGREAVLTYAWVHGASSQGDAVAATVQRYAELLREDDESWARAGATLAEARNFALARRGWPTGRTARAAGRGCCGP